MKAGVWNACVLLRELRERDYKGSYTILTDWLRPQRQAAAAQLPVRQHHEACLDYAVFGWLACSVVARHQHVSRVLAR